jgi:outer membrane protein W
VGFAVVSPINDFIGIGVYDSIIFPQELKATAGGVTVTTKRNDYKLILGNEMLLGPVFTVYQKEKIRIPAAVGFHMFTLVANGQNASSLGYEFGLGGNIGCEYYFNERWYVVGRVAVNWDFYSITRLDTPYGNATDSGTFSGFGFAPQLGFGYKF